MQSPLARLHEWVSERHGGFVTHKVAVSAEGRSLRVMEAVEPAEVIIQLRVSDLITAAAAEDDELIGAAFKGLREEDRASQVASLVLYLATLLTAEHQKTAGEEPAASEGLLRFSPYVAALPPNAAAATPQRWPEAARAPLMGTSLAAALQQQQDVLRELCDAWLPRLLGRLRAMGREGAEKIADGIGSEQVAAAFAMVESRAFLIKLPGGEASLSLIPLVDMADHSFRVKTDFRTQVTRASGANEGSHGAPMATQASGDDADTAGNDGGVALFQLVAGTRQEAGELLWINYGSSKGNGDLLVHHGLCIPDNPADRFATTLRLGGGEEGEGPPPDLPALLRSSGLSPKLEFTRGEPLSSATLRALAVLHLPPHAVYALASLTALGLDNKPEITPASAEAAAAAGGGGGGKGAPSGSIFSAAFLKPSLKGLEASLPRSLVPAVAATLRRLTGRELQRCLAAAEGLPDAMEVASRCPTGSAKPEEAAALYVAGQVELLGAVEREVEAWEAQSSAATAEAGAGASSGGEEAKEECRWHSFRLEVPAERGRLLLASGIGLEHFLPELPSSASEEASPPGPAVIEACWRRVLMAACVLTCSLAALERCGAPGLLEAAARAEADAEGPEEQQQQQQRLVAGADASSQSRVALAEASASFRSGIRSLLLQGDAEGPAAEQILPLIEDEARQVEAWQKDVEEMRAALVASGAEAEELEEAEEDAKQLADGRAVLGSWMVKLTRMCTFARRGAADKDPKRRRTVG